MTPSQTDLYYPTVLEIDTTPAGVAKIHVPTVTMKYVL